MEADWSLTQTERDATRRRTAENLFVLAFSRKQAVTDKDAYKLAKEMEINAYTVARVQSSTTTGKRPDSENVKAYARALSTALIEYLKHGSKPEESKNSAAIGETFVLGGKREYMTEELAEKQLAPLFQEGTAIKKIKLSTKSFSVKPDNSAQVVVRAFEAQNGSLTDVDLSDVIAGRPESEALAALKILSDGAGKLNLERLDLSDNALGEKGLRACASAIQDQGELQHLALRNVGCSINACKALRELLNRPENLTSMHFHNNMSDNEGASAIADILARASKMTDFKMVSSRVGPDGGNALLKALRAGSSLSRLELSDNPMTSKISSELAETIRSQPNLKALVLNDTLLCEDGETEGLSEICEALKDSASGLEELEFALNEITPEGGEVLGAMISQKQSLKRLSLRENELESEGTISVAKAIHRLKNLEFLDLSQNQIKSSGGIAIAKALTTSKNSIKKLALDENEISEAGISRIKEILEKEGLGNILSLEENDAEGDEEDDVEEIEFNASINETDLLDAFSKTGIN